MSELASATNYAYVLIPADTTKPMCELSHRQNTTLEDDDLREALKLRFAQGSLSAEQLESYVAGLKVQIAEKMPDYEDKGVTDAQLRSLAAAVSVDTFALTVPSKTAPYAVSLYCDDKGRAKNLARNDRAIGLAAAAGASTAQDFRGDCFVSRYFDDDDAWVRKDFTLADCSSDAAWVKAAAASAAKAKSPGGMAALSAMYDQLGAGGSAGGAGPLQIDAREEERKLMAAEHATDTYAWTQTEDEVEIRVPLPAGARSRDVAVAIKRTAVRVALKAGGDAPLDVPALAAPVDVDASTWYVDGAVLVMTLEKAKPARWDTLA